MPRVKLRPVFERANLFHSSENDGIFDRIDFRSSERYSNYDIYFSSNTHTQTVCPRQLLMVMKIRKSKLVGAQLNVFCAFDQKWQ